MDDPQISLDDDPSAVEAANIPWHRKILWITSVADGIGVAGLVIALVGILAGALIAIYAARTVEEVYNIVVLSALILGALCVASLFYILHMTFLIQEKFVRAARMRDRFKLELSTKEKELEEVKREKQRLTETDTDVAPKFAELSRLMRNFETRISTYSTFMIACLVDALVNDKPFSVDRDTEKTHWDGVEATYRELLDGLTGTAVGVLWSKKTTKHRLSANIKIIEERGADSIYKPVRRSPLSHEDRYADDERLKRKPVIVEKNRIYEDILLDKRKQKWRIIDDMDAYVREIVKLKELRKDYDEPQVEAAKLFKSKLSVAVTTEGWSDPLNNGKRGMEFHDSDNLLGFLCIDCEEPYYFEEGYQVEIMKQLANHVASAVRSYYSLEALRDRMEALQSPQLG